MNANASLLERIQATYSAVLRLSEVGAVVESVDMSGAEPLLICSADVDCGIALCGSYKQVCGCVVRWQLTLKTQ